jgi:hypothetical protein
MVYAIISIGLLGFIVWSFYNLLIPYFPTSAFASGSGCLMMEKVMALLCRETEVINFTIGWNVLMLLTTFDSTNVNNYNQSAGNSKSIIKRGSSETIRENSFEIFRDCYLNFYNKPININDN